ncbi:hypothetical protein N665_0056s0015 [Sinapis alba]|nr:hypothetical protein N665_0056s0015 [Sinapis alba]
MIDALRPLLHHPLIILFSPSSFPGDCLPSQWSETAESEEGSEQRKCLCLCVQDRHRIRGGSFSSGITKLSWIGHGVVVLNAADCVVVDPWYCSKLVAVCCFFLRISVTVTQAFEARFPRDGLNDIIGF